MRNSADQMDWLVEVDKFAGSCGDHCQLCCRPQGCASCAARCSGVWVVVIVPVVVSVELVPVGG